MVSTGQKSIIRKGEKFSRIGLVEWHFHTFQGRKDLGIVTIWGDDPSPSFSWTTAHKLFRRPFSSQSYASDQLYFGEAHVPGMMMCCFSRLRSATITRSAGARSQKEVKLISCFDDRYWIQSWGWDRQRFHLHPASGVTALLTSEFFYFISWH